MVAQDAVQPVPTLGRERRVVDTSFKTLMFEVEKFLGATYFNPERHPQAYGLHDRLLGAPCSVDRNEYLNPFGG
jgi:hypothetical protein